MSDQLDLFTDADRPRPLVPTSNRRGATIQERFELFHASNPWVYRRFVAMARALVADGHERIGMKMLFEVARWQYMRTVDPSSEFKLCNDYHSRYARLIAAQEPDLSEVFAFRELRAA